MTVFQPLAPPADHQPLGAGPAEPARLIAPLRHTVILVLIFVALAAAGAYFQKSAPSRPAPPPAASGNAGLYLSLIAAEWGLVYFVWKGVRRRGISLGDLVGGRWSDGRQIARDLVLAAAFWASWKLISLGIETMSGPDRAAGISGFLPGRPLDIALWIALSVSAGFAEEIVFRGYLQRQFVAITRSRWIGLALQAALFGIAHGYQGVMACTRIALLGAGYGALALWRRSLRPGMMAHAGTDILSGIFRI